MVLLDVNKVKLFGSPAVRRPLPGLDRVTRLFMTIGRLCKLCAEWVLGSALF